jgi:hypothetical protein
MHSPTFCAFCILCVAQTMANYKFPPCLLGTSIGLINVLKGNFSCLYFELQQPLKGSFSCRNIWWVNKETNGHGFYSVCAFVIIMWSKIPNFLNGECQRPNDKTHFVQKRCTLIPSSSFESIVALPYWHITMRLDPKMKGWRILLYIKCKAAKDWGGWALGERNNFIMTSSR